jgi:glycerate 2-kinase
MRSLIRRAFDAAIEAVDAERVTQQALRTRPISGPVHVIALGKAAIGMCQGALAGCDVVDGIVIAPHGIASTLPSAITVMRGRHPVPDPQIAIRGTTLLERAASVPEADSALVLISGGGSALVDAPVDGMDADALAALTTRLLRSGASIDEINAIRVALSRSKGGGLARALCTRSVRVLVMSDVVGDDGSRVASGPMSAWRGASPAEVARRPHVAAALGDAAPLVARWIAEPTPSVALEIVADNARAVAAARAALSSEGLRVADGPALTGEARVAGVAWARAARTTSANALVAGGETVVFVHGHGRGGRNQELALAALVEGIGGTFLCAGTDGIDGQTNAAGAIVDEAVRASSDVATARAALDDNDSTTFFERHGGLLVTGPTGTNVADLAIWTR